MASTKSSSITAVCPGCDTKISFKKPPKLGQFITCHECGDLVEVVSLSPLRLDWSPDDDDDDYDDYDLDDDDDYDDD